MENILYDDNYDLGINVLYSMIIIYSCTPVVFALKI